MEAEKLKDLLDKYLAGTINSVEQDELRHITDDAGNRLMLEDMMEKNFMEESFGKEENAEIGVAVQEWLHQKINAKRKKSTIFWIIRLAAAACFIAFMAIGIRQYLLFNDEPTSSKPLKRITVADFSPGKVGAILTLANGEQILLDSAANGKLANQAGVSINKKDGQIFYNGSGEVVYNTMMTPRGRQYTLVLADNSKVVLNAASSIRYPTSFEGDERVVEIFGEAYFEIAKDPTKKFIVKTPGGVRTEVLGTHFTINSYSDEENITTTLLEGSIRVSSATNNTILQPGNQVKVNNQGLFHFIQHANLEEATSWYKGYFYFEKADVKTVMRQLSRWYDFDVEYGKNVSREFFGGKIQRNLKLPAVMEILETIGVEYKTEGRKLIVGASIK